MNCFWEHRNIEDMEQNNELRTAWDFVENTGRSIFLTGKAGTGKTTFLKTVVEQSRKRPIVVAPTGVAAINAGGVTIHSFFQLPFEALREPDFLERVRRSAEYFADVLSNVLAKPMELTARVETNNKQAARRLGSALADERQTWLSLRCLLVKIAERGFTVGICLKERHHAMLDAMDEGGRKKRCFSKKNI